jgi:hypothetical protein
MLQLPLVQLLLRPQLRQRPLVLQERLPVEDLPVDLVLPVPEVRVTRVDLLQPLTPRTSALLTVAVAVEISGRCGRTSG